MHTHNFDAVVIGNAGIDTNVYLPAHGIDFSVEANFTLNLDCVGQAGGYASRGFARLGWRTAFIGAIGDDPVGRFLLEEFQRDGIDTSAVFTDPAGTSRSVNLMFPDGRRKNFYDGKSHMTLRPDLEACRRVLCRSRIAHFNIPNWARHLLPIARECAIPISCDLQDIVDPDDPYRRDFIQAADFLFFSAANFPDPEPLVGRFLAAGRAHAVIVGMGARGALLGTRQSMKRFGPVGHPKPVADTNGAGDSLAVGFLASHLLKGASPEDALLRGQIAARHACTLRANSSALITREQLEQRARELGIPSAHPLLP